MMKRQKLSADVCWMLLLIATVALCPSPSAAVTRYDGDEVLNVIMDDGLSSVINAMHATGPELEIWQQLSSTSAHVYVPRSLTAEFRHRLDVIGAKYQLHIPDVQRLINEERESNMITETGYQKRSVSHFQSLTSIINVYPTYDQLTAWLTAVSQQYSSVCSLLRIGNTVENRHIYVLKIFDNSAADTKRPAIWIDAGIHAREWITVSTAVYLIRLLLTTFTSRTGDCTLRQLDWYIAPLLNPDGYAYSHHKDGDRLWRKNRMQYNESISYSRNYNMTCIGVDLNRNFEFQWGTVFPNDEPCYNDYGGPWPSSEQETRSVVSFVLERRETIVAFLTVHNFGQMILTRWAYSDKLYPPGHNETLQLLEKMVDVIYQTGRTKYRFGTAPQLLYTFSGGSGDWARGVAGIKYSLEMELRDRGQLGFVLPTSFIQPVGEEAWSAVRVLASHIVTEQLNDSSAVFDTCMRMTTPGLSRDRTRPLRTSIDQTTDSASDHRATCSVCAVILLKLVTERLRLTA